MTATFSFETNQEEFYADLLEVVHLFFVGMPVSEGEIKINHTALFHSGMPFCRVEVNEKKYTYEYNLVLDNSDELVYKRFVKRYSKLSLYRAISSFLGLSSPWGSLTGVRPTKLWYDLIREGHSDIEAVFKELFLVSPQKTTLTKSIIETQKELISYDKNAVDLYIGIPFCASRCRYCSFSSGLISKWHTQLERYVSCLISEIRASQEIIEDKGMKLRSIYVGGGTPSSLPIDLIDSVLKALPKNSIELTVEAGRPDGISREILDVLKDNGVSRISINPQTLNNKTLLSVGRSHTAEDFFEKFEMAKSYGFIINSDLIAALEGEMLSDFKHSIDRLIALTPENITVHTLALKRGSDIAAEGKIRTDTEEVKRMIDYSYSALIEAGYKPYYMYRQKYMAGNFENVGYTKEGYACRYNIDMMEETTNILACGAGAISKGVFIDDAVTIKRAPNVKDISTYLSRFNEMIARKRKLFDTNW